jgi:hypothetical protein
MGGDGPNGWVDDVVIQPFQTEPAHVQGSTPRRERRGSVPNAVQRGGRSSNSNRRFRLGTFPRLGVLEPGRRRRRRR